MHIPLLHSPLHSLSADRFSLRTLHARTGSFAACGAGCCVACAASAAVAYRRSCAPRAGLQGPLTGILVGAPEAQQFQGAGSHLFAHGQQDAGAEQGIVGVVKLIGTPPAAGERAVFIVNGIFCSSWSTATCKATCKRFAAGHFGSLQWAVCGSCSCSWAKFCACIAFGCTRDIHVIPIVASRFFSVPEQARRQPTASSQPAYRQGARPLQDGFSRYQQGGQ